MNHIHAERLRELLHYEPTTGVFTWLIDRGRTAKVGDVAGCVEPAPNCYIRMSIDGKKYRGHNLAWLYMTGAWPKDYIDHIDGNPQNNKWDNLRPATRSQNYANRKRNANNKSGYKGVFFIKKTGTWFATINVDGQRISLGTHPSPEEAHATYLAAAREHFGEFARAG